MLQTEVCDCVKPLQTRVAKLVEQYEDALNYVKEANNQDMHDFLARRLYDITAEIIMSLLIIEDATRAPELFKKSANVFVRMTEEDIIGKVAFIKSFTVDDLKSFTVQEEAPVAE